MELKAIRYPSKIGTGLVIFLVVVIGGTFLLMAWQNLWLGVIPLGLAALFICHLLLTTYYIIEGRNLVIRSGFLYHKTIDIEKIKKITVTNLAMSAPATSLDRLELLYNTFDSILISPKDKEGLLKQLKKINPTIDIKV